MQKRVTPLPGRQLKVFANFKRLNTGLVVIGMFVLIYQIISKPIELYWFVFVFLFAVIEHINYYYVRLSYQTIEEIKELKRQKGFRKSRLAKELESLKRGGRTMDATFYMEKAVFNYRVAAVMILDNHVLIHKQAKDEHWALPGGRVVLQEDSQTSIVREIKEELGIDVKVDRLLWFTENFFEYNNKDYHEIGLYYKVSPLNGSFNFHKEEFFGEEGDRLIYQWVPISSLEKIKLYPEFIRTSMNELPEAPQHLIVKQYSI